MKAVIAGAVFVICLTSANAQAPTQASNRLDAATKKEIVAVEKRLAEAIEAHQPAALGPLLADYFADSEGQSERAQGKQGALRSCAAGTLRSYRIRKSSEYSRSADIITVQGVAQESADTSTDVVRNPEFFHVRRIWKQEDGRWVLVAQIRQSLEDHAPSEKDHEQ